MERIRHTLIRSRPDGVVVRGRLRDVEREDDGPDLDAALAELESIIASPLVSWLRELNAPRAFLVAGTSVTSLPIDCCPSAIESGVEFCFLPTGRALGFVRAVRRPLPEIHFLVSQEEQDEYAVERMMQARGKGLLVVDPTRTLQFAPLEAAMVRQATRDRHVQVLDQDTVSKEEIQWAAGNVEILHLIGHGTFNDQSPYRSGMYLDRRLRADGLWTNAELFSAVKAPAGRLVILSGCETGRTRPNLVSEEVSLPAALLAAGYAACIGSRWPVDDLSTTLLMGEFYDRWCRGGVGVAKALKASADWLRMLRRDDAVALVRGLPEKLTKVAPDKADMLTKICLEAAQALQVCPERPFHDPNYWAAFFVAGDGAITSDGLDPRTPTTVSAG